MQCSRLSKDCDPRSSAYHGYAIHVMADIITISEAARRYRPSRSTILREVQVVAANPQHESRGHVLPSVVEYQVIEEKKAKGENPDFEFRVSTALLDELYERRAEGEVPLDVHPKIDAMSDNVGISALRLLEETHEGLWKQLAEKDRQLAESARQLKEKDRQIERRDAENRRKDKEVARLHKALWRATGRQLKLMAQIQGQLPRPSGVPGGVEDATIVKEESRSSKKPTPPTRVRESRGQTSGTPSSAAQTARQTKRGRGVLGWLGRKKPAATAK